MRFDVISPNMFAGSIIDLQPDTEYEVLANIFDPDGVSGVNKKIITVRTRAEPMPYAGGRVFHVYPHGTPNNVKIQPAFEGLLAAYNNSSSGTDMTMATRPRVRAGDTILVHAGTYKYKREHYTNTASLSQVPFDGTYYLTGTGTADKPIAIKAAGDGEVIFDGNGAFNLFNVKGGDYHYFEGLTFRNTEIAIWAGTQRIIGAKGLTVKKSRFENIGMGVYTNHARSSNFYIADNWFIGRNRTDYLISWSDASFANFLGVAFPPSDGEPSDDSDAAGRPEVGLVHRGEDLRSGARDGLQLRERLPRRDRQRDLRQPGGLVRDRPEPAGHHRRAEVPAAGVLGPAAGGAGLSTTT